MPKIRFVQILLVVVASALAATQTPAPKSTKKTASPKKTSSAAKKSTPTKKSASTKKSTKAPVASVRAVQRTPTPERYKEIQQALASKGYLESASPSGVWDEPSVTALKKFQHDQSLEPSGKIDSLSLIALGLGPKRDQPPPPQP